MRRMRDIVSQPGLVKALRDEMEDVLARHNGVFTINALYQMKLLDSVMKESQRMHMLGPCKLPPMLTTLNQLTLRPTIFTSQL